MCIRDRSIYFQFDVTNLGNSDDEYTLTSTGTMISQATPNNLGWSSKVVGSSLSETNYLKVTVPQSNDGPWNAVVTVTSAGNPTLTNSLKFTLTGQVLPDATIRDLTLTPSNPKPDERVTARFSIFAEDADLDSIYYTVYLDNNVIGGDRVFGIESNGFETVSFSFTASEGDHTFKVKLYELGDISESDFTNNEIEQSFTVEAEASSNLIIYIVVVIVAAVAGAVYYRYRYSQKGGSPRLSIKKKPVISDTSIKFPIILNCLQCSSRVRVARPGSFRCPSCKTVSDVDANGEMEITEKADDVKEEAEEKSITAVPKEEDPKEKSKSRLSRMEQFLAGNKEEEIEEKPKGPKLSASEKLKLLKEDSKSKSNSSQEFVEVDEESDEDLSDDEPKRSKKRKNPPEGGSFGPTVGGF